MEKLLSMKEVSEILGVTKKTLREWGKNNVLKSVRLGTGKHRRYLESDIEEFIKKSKEK